jgi:DNA-binding transcriptional LysR family regulator
MSQGHNIALSNHANTAGRVMNLRQIEVFRAVMLAGSVTDAARSLHVSQPGISRMLSHIELQLGLRLFERHKGRLRPRPRRRRCSPKWSRSTAAWRASTTARRR